MRTDATQLVRCASRGDEGDRSAARRNLEAAYRSFDGEERYTYQAKIVLQKLRLDPDWPARIPVAADDSAGDAERDSD